MKTKFNHSLSPKFESYLNLKHMHFCSSMNVINYFTYLFSLKNCANRDYCNGEMYHKNPTSSFLDIKCEPSFKMKPLKCILNAFNSSFLNFLSAYHNQYTTVMISYAWKTRQWKNVFHIAWSLLALGYIKLQGFTLSCENGGSTCGKDTFRKA